MTPPVDHPYDHHPTLDRSTGVLTASHSTVKMLAVCETQALLWAWQYQSKEELIAATAGTAWHEAMAVLFRTRDVTAAKEKLRTTYQEFASLHVDPNGGLARLTYENVSLIFDVWTQRYTIDDTNMLCITENGAAVCRVLPQYVEIPAEFPLPNSEGLVLRAKLDAIVEEPHAGHWLVSDHKTTGQLNVGWIKQWESASQMTLYKWIAAQHVVDSGRQVIGGLIMAAQLAIVPGEDPGRKCATHKVPYGECRTWPPHVKTEMIVVERSDATVDLVLKDVVRKMNRLRELMLFSDREKALARANVNGMLLTDGTNGCVRCFAAQWCLEGRRVRDMDGMFAKAEGNGNG